MSRALIPILLGASLSTGCAHVPARQVDPARRIAVEVEVGPESATTRTYRGRLLEARDDSVWVLEGSDTVAFGLAGVVGVRQERSRLQQVLALASLADAVAGAAGAAGAALAVGTSAGNFTRRVRVDALRPGPLPGTLVRVRDVRGRPFTGRWAGEEGGALALLVEGRETRIPLDQVGRVEWRSGRVGLSPVPPFLLGIAGMVSGAIWGRGNEWHMPLRAVEGAVVGAGLGTAVSIARSRSWRWEGVR